jgi:hypothetical protein
MMRVCGLVGVWLGLSAGTAIAQRLPPQPDFPSTAPTPNGIRGTGHIADPVLGTTRPTFPRLSAEAFAPPPSNLAPAPFPQIPAPSQLAAPLPPQSTVGTAGPVQPAAYTAPAPPDILLPFNAASVEVRYQGGHWVWTDGRTEYRDFGSNQAAARAALQMVRELRPTQYGAIGTPAPVVEYWLNNGKAAEGIISQREVVPFEPEKLRVHQVNGTWVLGDNFQILCNFGPNAAEAQRALAVCQRYGFNELALFGGPTPAMTVLLYNPTRTAIDRSKLSVQSAKPLPRQALNLPGAGWVGELVTFDPHHVEVVRRGRDWLVRVDGFELANYGLAEMDANLAARTLQDYRLNEYVHVGQGGFGFFLSYNRPPTAVPLGVKVQAVHPDKLEVKQHDGHWGLFDGHSLMYDFGPDGDGAKQALAALKHYGFDTLCQVGSAPQALRYFTKGR